MNLNATAEKAIQVLQKLPLRDLLLSQSLQGRELQKYLTLFLSERYHTVNLSLLLKPHLHPKNTCRRKRNLQIFTQEQGHPKRGSKFPIQPPQLSQPHCAHKTHASGNQIPANNQVLLGDPAIPWQHWKQPGDSQRGPERGGDFQNSLSNI